MNKKPYRPGWPAAPDGSFIVGPGEDAWRAFIRVATDEQVRAALRELERLPMPSKPWREAHGGKA
jgi:hypothetical protein